MEKEELKSWIAGVLAGIRWFTMRRRGKLKQSAGEDAGGPRKKGAHMEVINEVFPTDPAQMQKLMEPGPKGPIFMVNLLKFKDRAAYDDGRETNLSGRQAYMIYGRAVAELLPKFGGRGLFAADVTFLSLGKVEELWDEIAIASYPDRASMVRMSLSEEWRAIAVHRSAGLKGQLNIECVAPEGMTQFNALTQG